MTHPGTEADAPAILACFRACFGQKRDLAAWRHQYLANPSGAPVIVLKREGDAVVSHAALLPKRIVAFGQAGVAGQSIDAMTHPDRQGQGLSRTLAAQAQAEARERGFVATYGFSNEESTHGILKHQGRRAVRPFPVLVRPLRPLRAAFALVAAGLRQEAPRAGVDSPKLVGFGLPRFDEAHSDLWRDVDALPAIAVVRDAAHLRWRYPVEGAARYHQRDLREGGRLQATAVVRTMARFGLSLAYLTEWHWRTGAESLACDLVRASVDAARSQGAHGVAALAMPGTRHRQLLIRAGFVPIPERLFPGTVVLSVRSESVPADKRWFTARSWHLTWGDLDVL